MEFITRGLVGIIFWINSFFKDFGISIIFFTFILKIILSPLEFLVFLEEEKIKRLRPKMDEILKKYKNDFQKQAELLAEIYKKENYNPLFTIFVQFLPLPIFFGVFFALSQILRTPGYNLYFLGSINLAEKNYFLFLTMAVLQYLTLLKLPKEQRKVVFLMFGLIIIILIQFPALFTLYWIINLILTFIQRLIFERFAYFKASE
jgi:YidC/Oxa1 family membrane protein insertase